MSMTRFGIIGLGEVGGIFARDLHAGGATHVVGYDTSPAARDRATDAGHADISATARAAAAEADVVFVAVTAGSALDAAASLAGGLEHCPFVVDVNSVSPATKREAAAIVARAGGRFVEAAVMSSVPPHGLRTPMLLGGPDARDWADAMAPFGMRLESFGDEIGGASSVKMCRSVMIKGLEALATESLLAARHYGVEKEVLATLADTLPHPDWPGLAHYLISRALIHGRRRAEEMREVARTVADTGLAPLLSLATAERQQWAAELGSRLGPALRSERDLAALLDSLDAVVQQSAANASMLAPTGAGSRSRQSTSEGQPT